MKHRSTEQMLSDMADQSEKIAAAAQGLTVKGLRDKQYGCKHTWENHHYYDECSKCGAARA